MYVNCGSMADTMLWQDCVSWSKMMRSYIDKGEPRLALELFEQVEEDHSDSVMFLLALKACSKLAASTGGDNKWKVLHKGMALHSRAAMNGFLSHANLANTVVVMYAKCGSMLHARAAFDDLASPNGVSWNALLQGYVENGDCELALEIYDEQGYAPDSRTYVTALSACAVLAGKQEDGRCVSKTWLGKAKSIHSQAAMDGACDVYVMSRLVDVYAGFGCMVHARSVFEDISRVDTVSWNALLQGYAENGEAKAALELFQAMEEGGGAPNSRSYIAALTACANSRLAESICCEEVASIREKGKSFHSQAVMNSCSTIILENRLVDMYAKCGSLLHARSVFDNMRSRDTITWTSLMQGYIDNGESEAALELFETMLEFESVSITQRTCSAAIAACAALADSKFLEKGKAIHSLAVTKDCLGNILIGNLLIDMYAKCGSMVHSQCVFNSMVERNVVSWTSLASGYALNGDPTTALRWIAHMDSSGIELDARAFVAALMICRDLMTLEIGSQFHSEIRSRNLDGEVLVANSLVDFYAKCGSLGIARQVFDSIPVKTVAASWNTMIGGYSTQGDMKNVFELLERMRQLKLAPNEITFVHVLSGCSHAGLTDEAKDLFESMQSKYGVNPTVYHYACMVDLLGRSNRIQEALQLVKSMPWEPGAVTWKTILSACREVNDVGVAREAYKAVQRLDASDCASYVLMSNLYSELL